MSFNIFSVDTKTAKSSRVNFSVTLFLIRRGEAGGEKEETILGVGQHQVQKDLKPQAEAQKQNAVRYTDKVEHPFWVVKYQSGNLTVRNRGLTKGAAPLFSLFALVNLCGRYGVFC